MMTTKEKILAYKALYDLEESKIDFTFRDVEIIYNPLNYIKEKLFDEIRGKITEFGHTPLIVGDYVVLWSNVDMKIKFYPKKEIF